MFLMEIKPRPLNLRLALPVTSSPVERRYCAQRRGNFPPLQIPPHGNRTNVLYVPMPRMIPKPDQVRLRKEQETRQCKKGINPVFCCHFSAAPLALGGLLFRPPRLASVSPRRCLGCRCRPPPWSRRLVGWPSAAVLALLAARPGCVGPWLG